MDIVSIADTNIDEFLVCKILFSTKPTQQSIGMWIKFVNDWQNSATKNERIFFSVLKSHFDQQHSISFLYLSDSFISFYIVENINHVNQPFWVIFKVYSHDRFTYTGY